MVRYECDSCHALKRAGEVWILGFAAENIGAVTARREVTIVSAWDETRAVDYLAVHFCSDECRRKYMTHLFAEEPAQKEVVETVTLAPARVAAVSEKHIVREFPGRKVETIVEPERPRPNAKSRRKRKAA
jgi:hypothetical protein